MATNTLRVWYVVRDQSTGEAYRESMTEAGARAMARCMRRRGLDAVARTAVLNAETLEADASATLTPAI